MSLIFQIYRDVLDFFIGFIHICLDFSWGLPTFLVLLSWDLPTELKGELS